VLEKCLPNSRVILELKVYGDATGRKYGGGGRNWTGVKQVIGTSECATQLV